MMDLLVTLFLMGLVVFLLLILNEMSKDIKRIANALEDKKENRNRTRKN